MRSEKTHAFLSPDTHLAPWPTELGRRIRARRRALKLSQLELAALAGVGPAFLYQLEHGKPSVRLDKVLDVLAVLGLGLTSAEGPIPWDEATPG